MFGLFTRRAAGGSAPVARERLQVVLAHERAVGGHSGLLSVLREEILAVLARHVTVEPDKVSVEIRYGDMVSTLTVDIEIPTNDSAPSVRSDKPAPAEGSMVTVGS